MTNLDKQKELKELMNSYIAKDGFMGGMSLVDYYRMNELHASLLSELKSKGKTSTEILKYFTDLKDI